MTDQGFDRLQELETENQCLLRELEEKNQRLRELEEENRRLREHEKESRQQQESGDEDLIQKRLIPKMNDTTFLDIGSYFTNEVLEDLLTSRNGLRIGGERKKVMILFSDLRRSTEISELLDATDFIRMLNHYLEEMIEIVNAWQGNILDFVGDSIVVVFGAPGRMNTQHVMPLHVRLQCSGGCRQ